MLHDFKPAQKRASPPEEAGSLEADGTAADAGGWRQERWAKHLCEGGQSGRRQSKGGGLVQEEGGGASWLFGGE